MNPIRRQCRGETDAWGTYRNAFEDFAQRVRQVQLLTAHLNPDRPAIDIALLELEKAHVVYQRCRDALAQQLLQSPTRAFSAALAVDSERVHVERVRAIAALRWEAAGRPDGTADDDWYRAEEIVRLAAAA